MLDQETAVKIGGALARLHELTHKSIVEKDDAAERRGNEQFLNRALLEHAHELLGAWFTIRNQYQPLIQGFACLVSQADGVIARIKSAQEASKPAAVDNSSKESK